MPSKTPEPESRSSRTSLGCWKLVPDLDDTMRQHKRTDLRAACLLPAWCWQQGRMPAKTQRSSPRNLACKPWKGEKRHLQRGLGDVAALVRQPRHLSVRLLLQARPAPREEAGHKASPGRHFVMRCAKHRGCCCREGQTDACMLRDEATHAQSAAEC